MLRVLKFAAPLALAALLMLAVRHWVSRAVPTATLQTLNTGQHFLPPYPNSRDRFGFDSGGLSGYDVAQLHAGWYSNWGASLDPAHPDGLVYVQLIRFKAGSDPHDPALVTVNPSKATLADIAAAHPGALWLMSNEPDSLYQGNPIQPDVYAIVYHDFYAYIKGLDPAALIANGGIVQPTPCRLQYLDIVLNTYQSTYGEPMPVDVWNIHAFILREVYGSWGASTPPGVDHSCGIDYAIDDADDMVIFENNIRAMRAWMKENGYQDRPLIISEYGILWPQWFAPQFTPARVSRFMTQTFDLFLHTTDADIGYPADDYRLVQAWAWYSLSDDQQYNGYLFNSDDKTLSPMGAAYRDYTAALTDTLYADLSTQIVAARPQPHLVSLGALTPPLTFVLPLTATVGNLGKLAAPDMSLRLELLSEADSTPLFAHTQTHTLPPRFEGLVSMDALTETLTVSGVHTLRLTAVAYGQTDPRPWNDTFTTTLDFRPDLALMTPTLRLEPTRLGSIWVGGAFALTGTVTNQGLWPAPATTATVEIATWPDGTPLYADTLAVSQIPIDGQQALTAYTGSLLLDHDFYLVTTTVNPEGRMSEQNPANNQRAQIVPAGVTTTLLPTATAVLTSAGGTVTLYWPAGAVTAPVTVRFTPLWLADLDAGPMLKSTLGFSLTAYSNERLTFAIPASLTWAYTNADVEGLDESLLRLFAKDGGWEHAACGAYQRKTAENRLTASLCRTGRYLMGVRYDLYLPLVTRSDTTTALDMPPDEGELQGPLRLP